MKNDQRLKRHEALKWRKTVKGCIRISIGRAETEVKVRRIMASG